MALCCSPVFVVAYLSEDVKDWVLRRKNRGRGEVRSKTFLPVLVLASTWRKTFCQYLFKGLAEVEVGR